MNFSHLKKYFLVVLLIGVITSFGHASQIVDINDQHNKIVLRSIAHEFLLQLNDSTSRILPIKKVEDRYVVQFEKTFSFEPDLLFLATNTVLDKNGITDRLIVEVERCGTNEVVHSFETNIVSEGDMMPCKGRVLPNGCYRFYFTIIEQEVKTPVQETVKKGDLNYFLIFASLIVLVIVISVLLFLYKRKKRSYVNSDLITIGQYQFDQKGMVLLLKTEPIELSSKESDLLYLLYKNENKTLERSYILREVWGDDGDYVGRTLDVFISKLRKKLESDSSLKIINVRGVGYRFVMN